MFRLAVDLRVFPELTKSQSPLSVAQLAESTKSSPELLGKNPKTTCSQTS